MAFLLYLVAGVLLIPPATPLGLLLWWVLWRHDSKKAEQKELNERQAQALEELANEDN